MTSARGVSYLREDVHIHAPHTALHRRLADASTHDDWLAASFRDYRADEDGCSFALALPLRSEEAHLRRDGTEPHAIVYANDTPANGHSAIESITWALHPEGPTEVHVTVETAYRPAGGLLGGLLEPLIHRPHRAQALRDSLWRLKLLVEGEQTGR